MNQSQLSRGTYYSAWHRVEIFIFSFTEMPTKSSQPFRRNAHKKAGRIRPWRQSFSEVLFLSKIQTERLRRASNRGQKLHFFLFIHTNLLSFWKKVRYALKSCKDFTHFSYEKNWNFMQYKKKGEEGERILRILKVICCSVKLWGMVFLHWASHYRNSPNVNMFPKNFQWDNKCHTLHAFRKVRSKEIWDPVKRIMKLHLLNIYGKIFLVIQWITAV